MILAHEQGITERYFFFSQGLNGSGKNEFVSQFTCLQPHLYVKYKNISTSGGLTYIDTSLHGNKHKHILTHT